MFYIKINMFTVLNSLGGYFFVCVILHIEGASCFWLVSIYIAL